MVKNIGLQEFADLTEAMEITHNIGDGATSLVVGLHPQHGRIGLIMDINGGGAMLPLRDEDREH